ncbi:unnamed protein product, partial [marine sediment metagenome]
YSGRISEIVRSYNSSQIVRITFLRDNSIYSISIPLIDLPNTDDETERIGIGVYADTKDLQCRFPLKIEINLEKIKGPSAGMMIALEVLNQLTENDLSGSLLIAGTGNNLSFAGLLSNIPLINIPLPDISGEYPAFLRATTLEIIWLSCINFSIMLI